MPRHRFFAFAALTCTLVAAVISPGPGHAAGFANYFATLNGSGAVVTSSGVGSASRTAVGRYEVTFNRDITGCALLVNVNGTIAGYGVTRRKGGSSNVVEVRTFNQNGALTNLPSTVFVVCNN